MLKHAAGLKLPPQHFALEPAAVAGFCTTARLGVASPPMKSEMPTTPSLPVTAISAEDRFCSTYRSDSYPEIRLFDERDANARATRMLQRYRRTAIKNSLRHARRLAI